MNKIEELIAKVEAGQATKEEQLALLKTLNVSLRAFKILLDEVKSEQILKDIKNS